MVREHLICFVTDDNEKKAIKDNATFRNMSMSAFIRDRTVRGEMTNDELADYLMINVREILKTQPLPPIIRKERVKPPPEIPIEVAGMTEAQRKRFEEYEKEKQEARGVLIKELKQCLLERKSLEECNIEILEEGIKTQSV